MSTRFGVSTSGNAHLAVGVTQPRRGLRWMSERQTEAYLMTRDTLRRIQRSLPSVPPISIEGQAAQGRPEGRT